MDKINRRKTIKLWVKDYWKTTIKNMELPVTPRLLVRKLHRFVHRKEEKYGVSKIIG
ncbi:hypothetical protein J7L13_03005 [bacterium]|nr:hypothetical protein [bacterium]